LERAVALCNSHTIGLLDLPPAVKSLAAANPVETKELPAGGLDLEDLIAQIESDLIRQALRNSRHSQKRAAQLLGLTPRSLRYRLQKYNLNED
ncbi:MAG: helix-turn-helix domain-containing protein, partial [Candidatus Hydrogenedentales bacterium]